MATAQHMTALELANEVRFARLGLKRDIRAGKVMVAEVLAGDIPDWLGGMRVEDLARSAKWMPRPYIHRGLHAAGASLTRTCGALTDRQRHILAAHFADREAPIAERARQRQAQTERSTAS